MQKKLPNARALVLPAMNHTHVPTLQPVLEDAFLQVMGDLSLPVYPGAPASDSAALNTVWANPALYDYVVRVPARPEHSSPHTGH